MGRSAPQLAKFACLKCRTAMKREALLPIDTAMRRNAARPIEIRACPSCGDDSYWMGSAFRAPPKSDLKGWETVSMLIRAGLPYCKVMAPLPLDRLAEMGIPSDGVNYAEQAIDPWPTSAAEARRFIVNWGGLGLPFWKPGEPLPPGGPGRLKVAKKAPTARL